MAKKGKQKKERQPGPGAQKPVDVGPVKKPLLVAQLLSVVLLLVGLVMMALAGGVLAGRITDGWGFPMSASLTLGLAVTQDGARELASRDLAVHSAAARAIAAQGLTEATLLYEKGHADRAERLIRQRLESVILLNNSYIGDAKLGTELRELKATVRFRATPARSDEGKHLRKSLKSMATEMSR